MMSLPLLSSKYLQAITVAVCVIFGYVEAQSTQLTAENFDELINSHEFVLVNFYTDWCGFSRMLAPIYEEAAQKLKQNFPETGRVLLGKVNGDSAPSITARYKVTKYPTLKIFRHGAVSKREYRGQRSVEALIGYVHDMLLKVIVHKLESTSALNSLDLSKKHIIGYFPEESSVDMATLTRVAAQLHDDCQFSTLTGDQAASDGQEGSRLVFRQLENQRDGSIQHGPFPDHSKLAEWASSLCQPIVRELTFENAEEMTEAGLPFFILFYKSGDEDILTRYRSFIAKELMSARDMVLFLTADGSKFTHPLNHLGKSLNDLPLIVIDSFQHMYIWRHDVINDLEKPGLLKQFIDDLYSQKLHREFHQGPDPSQAAVQIGGGGGQGQGQVHLDVQHQVLVAPDGTKVQVLRVVQHDQPHADVKPALDQAAQQVEQQKQQEDKEDDKQAVPPELDQHVKREGDSAPGDVAVEQEQVIRVTVDKNKSSEEMQNENEVYVQPDEKSPPESVFKKLLPSPQRYSITRRDEL